MKDKYFNIYWIFIIILQVYLIIEKNLNYFSNDKFYLWNIVVIICAIVFLYSRMKLKKILINPEKIIILMFVLNGVSTIATQIILKEETLKIIFTIMVVLGSIYIGNSIKDNKKIQTE